MISVRSTIICIDDDKWILDVLANLLSDTLGKNYAVEKSLSGKEALEIIDDCVAEGKEISLVISDYIMPAMKGDEVLEQVKNRTPMTRRIMLTGFAAIDGISNAINKAGIYRFMSKPWDNKDMLLTVLQAIRSYEQDKQNEKLANSHKELYHKFQGMALGLQSSLQQAIETLSSASDIRESGVAGHAQRVAKYAVQIARKVGLSEENAKDLEVSALLHDVGKLALKDDELEAVRGLRCYSQKEIAMRQAELAKLILQKMDAKLLPGVIYHTERMDGQGPYGKDMDAIPIEAKIIGLSNYYDTMRAIRRNESPQEILNSMKPDQGKIIDPSLFMILAEIVDE